MASAAQEPEVVLAQRLAANEKSTRTKALKTFRKYLSVRSQRTEGGFTNDDLMKIWKGLFYCLWMQDKPLLQEELSEKISGLIHSFHTTDSQLLYFETFLQTLKREWNGIDRLRMDKFFQLVRFMFRQVFEVLKRREWDSSMVNGFAEVFTAKLLKSPACVPDGLLLHILDLYMTELGGVGSAELTAEQNLAFIDPFCKTMAKAKDRKLLASISKHIFSTIVEHASLAVEDLMKELGDSGEESDSGQASDNDEESVEEDQLNSKAFKKANRTKVNGIQRVDESDEGSEEELLEIDHVDSEEKLSDDETEPVLQFDYGAIADRLFELGSRSNTPNFNRGKVYRLVKIFRDLSEGVFPQNDGAAVNKKNKTNKKKRRKEPWADEDEYPAKKFKAACKKEPNPSEPDQGDTPSDDTKNHNKKKLKKKGKMKREDATEQTTELNKTEEDTETSTETSQATVETPAGSGGDAVTQQGEETHKNNEPSPESNVEASAKTSKRRKNKKLKSNLPEVEVEVAVEHELVSEDADKEVEGGTPETEALPSSRKKCGKKCKKNKSEESSSNKRTHEMLINVPHTEDIGASTPAKRRKKKQNSAAVVEEMVPAETGTDVKLLGDSSDKPEEASTMRKKKNKKQKGKEMSVEVDNRVEIEVKESDVAGDEPPVELKLSKKAKKKKMKLVPSEEKEPGDELEAACSFPHSCTLESSSSPVQLKKKKKTQKKQKTPPGGPRAEESLSAEATDETDLKKKSKKKQAAEVEAPETDCSLLTPLKKGKKKRKTQTEDVGTSQINGHTVDPEISTSLTPSKKMKKKKASSKSDFVSFHGQPKTPSPLFCKVKPKGSPSTPLSSLKTFLKSETKKVRFGLKNNKMTEFRKSDQSLLVSPVGESRVAFDPRKKPASGVLKSPSSSPSVLVKSPAVKRRPTAADFF